MVLQSSRRLNLKEAILNFVQHSLQMSQIHKSAAEFPSRIAFHSFDGGWKRGKLHKFIFYSLYLLESKKNAHTTHTHTHTKHRISDFIVVFMNI